MFPQCLADTFSFTVAAQVLFPGRVIIRMGSLGGTMEKTGVVRRQLAFQLLAYPVPDIRMVGAGKGRDGSAVDGVEAEGANNLVAAQCWIWDEAFKSVHRLLRKCMFLSS